MAPTPLFAAAVCGVLAGFLRATIQRRRLKFPKFRRLWLVVLALLLMLAANRIRLADPVASAALIFSQGLPLIFAWLNRRQPGLWLLGLGLALNLAAISLNGGFMPISPETLLALGLPPESWVIGQRLGMTKDLVLPGAETNLWPLSDWLISPAWFPIRGAFSIGDVLVAAGVFWVLWSAAGHEQASSANNEVSV